MGMAICVCLMVGQAHANGAIGDVERNNIKAPVRASSSTHGLIKMCPPGGEAFASAWELSCGMKKRRKRGIYSQPSELLNGLNN